MQTCQLAPTGTSDAWMKHHLLSCPIRTLFVPLIMFCTPFVFSAPSVEYRASFCSHLIYLIMYKKSKDVWLKTTSVPEGYSGKRETLVGLSGGCRTCVSSVVTYVCKVKHTLASTLLVSTNYGLDSHGPTTNKCQ